jgi:hypothetical protein
VEQANKWQRTFMLVLLEKNYRNLSLISLFRPNMPLLTPMARSCTGTVFWIAVSTVTGMEAETGFFDFSLEQAEEKSVKNSNPKIPMRRDRRVALIRVPR